MRFLSFAHSNLMNINLHNYDVVEFKCISTQISAGDKWIFMASVKKSLPNNEQSKPQKSWNCCLQLLPVRENFHEKFIDKYHGVDKYTFFLWYFKRICWTRFCYEISYNISSINVSGERNNIRTLRATHEFFKRIYLRIYDVLLFVFHRFRIHRVEVSSSVWIIM